MRSDILMLGPTSSTASLLFSGGVSAANPTPFFSLTDSGTVSCFFSATLTLSSKLVLLGRNSESDPLSSSLHLKKKRKKREAC